MNRRRIERVAVVLMSIIMLITSTGILTSVAAEVTEASSAYSDVSETTAAVVAEGGTTGSTTVAAEGGELVKNQKGSGKKTDPFIIETAEDFVKLSGKINVTTSSDKYFELASDIDLSTVSAETYKKCSGCLASINKANAEKSENVFFILDGKGHKIKGLNISSDTGYAGLFLFVNEKSVIKNLIIDSPVVKSSKASASVSVLVCSNRGTIENIQVINPTVYAPGAKYTGVIAASNSGNITGCLVKENSSSQGVSNEKKFNVSANGYVGVICGGNSGNISSSSAINVGVYVPSSEGDTYCGSVAGFNGSLITGCVAFGNINGTGKNVCAGGIAGRAYPDSSVSSCYVLVKIASSVSGNAVIGKEGTSGMLKDVYWSSAVSGCQGMTDGFGYGVNEMEYSQFIVVSPAAKVTFGSNNVRKSVWGKASFDLSGSFRLSGSSVSMDSSGSSAVLTSVKQDAASELYYNVKISFPDGIGFPEGRTVEQQLRSVVLSVGKDCKGDGSKENPLTVMNATELFFVKYAPGICVKLGADTYANSDLGSFRGVLDGNGHKLSVKTTLFSNIYGEVKNLNVVIKNNISSPVFGRVNSARLSSVTVSMPSGISFNAEKNETGILAGRVTSGSAITGCFVTGNVSVVNDSVKNSGALIGCIDGNNVSILQSGTGVRVTSVSGKKNIGFTSFIGSVNGENTKIESCSVGGANYCGSYLFVGSAADGNISVNNVYYTYPSDGRAVSSLYDNTKLGKILNEKSFINWKFENSNAFFTGKSGSFAIELPELPVMKGAKASDFALSFDAGKVNTAVSVSDSKAVVTVSKPEKVVSVKAESITLTHKQTGLSAVIYATNGLEKDSAGNYLVSNAYDFAFIGENISSVSDGSFRLVKDIDLSVLQSYTPIGSVSCAFTGEFDGNGKTVSGLKLTGETKLGLFGVVRDAEIKDINIKAFTVRSGAGYSGVLCAQTDGKSVLSGINVSDSSLTAAGNYAGIVAGSALNSAAKVENVTVSGCTVKSSGSYVGSVFGACDGNCLVENVRTDGFKAEGANYISGAVGLMSDASALSGITVKDSVISGLTEVSGIASGNGNNTVIKNSTADGVKVSSAKTSSAFICGGAASTFGSSMENVSVINSEICGGTASGVIGRTAGTGDAYLKNIKISGCNISAEGDSSVASAFIGNVSATGKTVIENVVADATVFVESQHCAAGFAGVVNGITSDFSADRVSVSAKISAVSGDNGTASAVIGRADCGSLNRMSLKNITADASVSSSGSASGFIGDLTGKAEKKLSNKLLSDSVLYPEINSAAGDKSGMFIGSVSGRNVPEDLLKNAFSNVVCSTYYGNVSAFGSALSVFQADYYDLDKPDGSPIVPSVNVIRNYDAVTVDIENLPEKEGFVFNSEKMWCSNSDERIQVVSSEKNAVVLKALHKGDVSVIGYYNGVSGKKVSVPVHFEISADIRTPLKGEGTEKNPYLISNAYDLETVASYSSEDTYFALCKNIVFTPADYEFGGGFYNVGNGIITIGNAEKAFTGHFSGRYNGKNYSITGLKTGGNVLGGLFGNVENAVIENLTLKNADIAADAYAGVIAGKAVNSVFNGIIVDGASVVTGNKAGLTGGLTGMARDCDIKNVSLSGISVLGYSGEDSSITCFAGGMAGSFSGKAENIIISAASVDNIGVTGGFAGMLNGDAVIASSDADVVLDSAAAGGIAGAVCEGRKLSATDVTVSGELNGKISTGGVAGTISAESGKGGVQLSAENIIVSAVLKKSDFTGIIAGQVDKKLSGRQIGFTLDSKELWYSSYVNGYEAFGSGEINSIQTSEIIVKDINVVKCLNDGGYTDCLEVSENGVKISDDLFKVAGNNYKKINIAGKTFEPVSVYAEDKDAAEIENGIIKMSSSADEAIIVFEYGNGLAAAAKLRKVSGLSDNTVSLSSYIVDETGKGLRDSLVSVMIKSETETGNFSYDYLTDVSQPVTDVSLTGCSDEIFVNLMTSGDTDFSLIARDAAGHRLKCIDAGAEGYLISTAGSTDIRLEITVTDCESITWGLHFVWGAFAK